MQEIYAFVKKGALIDQTVADQKRSGAVAALGHEFSEHAVAFFLVEIPLDDPIDQANLTVPKGLLERIDRYANEHHLSRSALLTQAAQQIMN